VNIYVGNLSRQISEEDLKQAFSAFGQVESTTMIKDKFTGEPRGFGFVVMPSKAEAESAIAGLNGKELKGQTLTANEARPRTEGGGGGRSGGGFDDRRGGGGGARRGSGGGGGGGGRYR